MKVRRPWQQERATTTAHRLRVQKHMVIKGTSWWWKVMRPVRAHCWPKRVKGGSCQSKIVAGWGVVVGCCFSWLGRACSLVLDREGSIVPVFFPPGYFLQYFSNSSSVYVCLPKTDSLPKGEMSMMKMKMGGRENESAQNEPCWLCSLNYSPVVEQPQEKKSSSELTLLFIQWRSEGEDTSDVRKQPVCPC